MARIQNVQGRQDQPCIERNVCIQASELCQILESETKELYFIKFPFVRRLLFLMARPAKRDNQETWETWKIEQNTNYKYGICK